MKTIAILALCALLTACGGGGDDSDQAAPAVNCEARPEVCR